ncbi:mariner Mos1 transposase [Trichonephila clavipes]|nr:mariner Mos1 transposase [Trichonephila clavipes]
MKKSAAEAHRMLSNTYGEAAISERTCREWFQRFKNGDFDVEDQHGIWWDQLDVVYYELLKPTETIIVILQHDNARPHVAKVVKTYLETLKWEVLPHPLYSPDIAPSDYHLFRSMAHGLADQHFRSYEEVKNWITSKNDQSFQRGIRTLPERWEKVVASDGQ